MRLLSLLIFILFNSAHALDLGDGSDGVCNWNNETLNQSLYNCSSLTLTGTVDIDPSITDVIFIKVQGDVEIDGLFRLSASGRDPGPGGYSGGLGGALDGGDGGSPAGALTARGRGGKSSLALALDPCAAAGGSGGRHSSAAVVNAAVAVDNSPNDCDPIIAQGGASPAGSYGDPLDFHNLIRGGAGGGAGGGADDSSITENGGDGGGGGGALKLYAGGNLIIRAGAQIDLTGSNGADTNFIAGAGGGGAGGAVLISVLGELEMEATATINVFGGLGGEALGNGTDGTTGGRGHIRLEDNDGIMPGVDGTSAPGASTGLNPVAANASTGGGSSRADLKLQSDLSTGCALREVQQNSLDWLFFLFIIVGLIISKSKVHKASRPRMTDGC